MNYYIYINKGLSNEQLWVDTYTDLEEAIEVVNGLKKSDPKAKSVCTGFYRDGQYVKMYFTGPLELL